MIHDERELPRGRRPQPSSGARRAQLGCMAGREAHQTLGAPASPRRQSPCRCSSPRAQRRPRPSAARRRLRKAAGGGAGDGCGMRGRQCARPTRFPEGELPEPTQEHAPSTSQALPSLCGCARQHFNRHRPLAGGSPPSRPPKRASTGTASAERRAPPLARTAVPRRAGVATGEARLLAHDRARMVSRLWVIRWCCRCGRGAAQLDRVMRWLFRASSLIHANGLATKLGRPCPRPARLPRLPTHSAPSA